ncbi:maleylpyruvate isomerase family mycothiol-dependent enzyme [Streptomyces sp. NPDC006134]|uniref:maleylpyruvate isomerase family mycothiol-dependent enzyme n=1 Tax=Streptomyces sp. NPDC006134 TaxID=3154467 RepID=UPI0033CCA613
MEQVGAAEPAARRPVWTGEVLDLRAEHQAFAALLSCVRDADWERPSAAAGWTIRDQVAHLADTEEVAADTLNGGPRAFALALEGFGTPEDFTADGCRRTLGMPPMRLISLWAQNAHRTAELLAARSPDERVAWGLGMKGRHFAAARLMEHWAHGLDVADALGLALTETPRLRHVAGLGFDTLRFGLGRARQRWPRERTLRLELTGADGTRYRFGPEDSTDVIRGPLIQWCCAVTRRRPRPGPAPLVADGELAELALGHARAYL